MKYKSFYRVIDLEKRYLYLCGEQVYIAYYVFENWIKQNEKSLEEMYVDEMNGLWGHFTRPSILGLLSLAEQWVNTRGKKHIHKKIYADCKIYNKSHQWIKSFDLEKA